MIGFTRNGKVKVWWNCKMYENKIMPLYCDISLDRYKEDESYMVDDLVKIFYNHVNKSTIPKDFLIR